MQSVRVTAATVPGPSGGYTSSSMLAALLYIGYVEQLQPNNILPRDREPCLVNDLNGLGLAPGYYDGRLAGSFNGLPVYNVGGAGGASNVTLPGLTQTQIANLTTNLSPGQVNILNNLNACQLQSLLGGTNTSQLQILTGSLTPTQLSNLVGNLTSSQITTLLGNLSVSQIQTLTTALSPSQIFNLVSTLTSQQLSILTVGISPSNVNSLVSQLSHRAYPLIIYFYINL